LKSAGRFIPNVQTVSKIVNVSELQTNFERLLEEVERSEHFFIERDGKLVAVLSACRNLEPRKPGSGNWQGKVRIADDFDDLPDEFLRAFNL
jgi:antitoxin (DNA-binding transcriptional repressor) of toxin-antitoxin stability system